MRVMTMLALACLCVQRSMGAVDLKDIEPVTDTDTPGAIGAVPFVQSSRGSIIVEVRLNGRGPFKFLFDTGSSHSAISSELANALDATPVARTIVASPIGEHVRTIVQLNRLDIGPVVADNVLPSVIPGDAARRIRGFQGVIGQDVLATRRYTIDFRGRRILWYDQPSVALGRALALEFHSGFVLVTLPQRAVVLRLVPDTAAEGLVLFRNRNLHLADWSAIGTDVEVSTLLERRNAQQVIFNEFRIGSSTLFKLPATILPNQHDEHAAQTDDAPLCDGLLPLRLFERVTFDGPGALMSVDQPRARLGRIE